MRKISFSRIACIVFSGIVLATTFLPSHFFAQPPLPSVAELIAKARINQEKIIKNYDQFSYNLTNEYQDSKTGEDRMTKQPTYEEFDRNQEFFVTFHRGFRVKVKIEDDHDDPNLSLKDIVLLRKTDPNERKLRRIKSEKKLIDELYTIKAQQRSSMLPIQGLEKIEGAWGKDILSFLKYGKFSNIETAEFSNRKCFALDFSPAPDGKYGKEDFVQRFGGTIWIDEKNFVVVRLEAYLTERKNDGKFKLLRYLDATIRVQSRVCDDLWLPSSAQRGFNFGVFKNDDFTVKTYRNYRRNGQPLTCNPQGLLQ